MASSKAGSTKYPDGTERRRGLGLPGPLLLSACVKQKNGALAPFLRPCVLDGLKSPKMSATNFLHSGLSCFDRHRLPISVPKISQKF